MTDASSACPIPLTSLSREYLFEELLKETDDVAAKRLACQEMRDLLTRALEIVNEVSQAVCVGIVSWDRLEHLGAELTSACGVMWRIRCETTVPSRANSRAVINARILTEENNSCMLVCFMGAQAMSNDPKYLL